MQFIASIIFLFASFTLASSLQDDTLLGLVERSTATCTAVAYAPPANFSNMRELIAKKYFCGTRGYLKHPAAPIFEQAGISEQACADECLCKFGEGVCDTIAYTNGVCVLYGHPLRKMGYRPLVTGPTTFFNRRCYRNSNHIHGTQTQSTPKATPPAKRSAVEDYLIDALVDM